MKMILLLASFVGFLSLSSALNDFERLEKSVLDPTGYIKSQPPNVDVNSTVNVTFSFIPVCFDLSLDGHIDGRVWFNLRWNDPRLAFDPQQFGGIDTLRVPANKIWIPDIYLYNRATGGAPMHPEANVNAVVTQDGTVFFIPDRQIRARCDAPGLDLENPWNEQSCSLQFGSWTYHGHLLDLLPAEEDDKSIYSSGCSSELVSTTLNRMVKFYDCCSQPYVSVFYNVTLKRNFIRRGELQDIIRRT